MKRASRLKYIIQPLHTSISIPISLLGRCTEISKYLGVKKWCSANVFFLTPNRNMFARKFVKSKELLAVLRGILLSMSSKLRFAKLVRFFE